MTLQTCDMNEFWQELSYEIDINMIQKWFFILFYFFSVDKLNKNTINSIKIWFYIIKLFLDFS